MSRSRSVNRLNRFVAKRRRRDLRSVVPYLQNRFHRFMQPFDHSHKLKEREFVKETMLDLLDTSDSEPVN